MSAFVDYFRCPPDLAPIGTQPELSPREGYFKFGDAIAFGRVAGEQPAAYATDPLPNVADAVTIVGRTAVPAVRSVGGRDEPAEERYRQNGYNFLQKSTAGLGRPASVLLSFGRSWASACASTCRRCA